MKAIVVETGKEVEVERGEPMENPMGWHSQMRLTVVEEIARKNYGRILLK
jgi:hypothetical protein